MRTTRKFTRQFQLHWPSKPDSERAIDTYARTKLSHGLSVNDALIAETSIGLGATLCTFNLKHFRAVAGLSHQQPYPKS